jgi:UDP-N-acetyl-D-glucosamine dehydrogenase
MFEQLKSRLSDQSAKVAVIGLGYVGLPQAAAFAEAGWNVVGLDIDERRVSMLNNGESDIERVPPASLRAMIAAGSFKATSDASSLSQADVILICVPTPLTLHREPDLGPVISAAEMVTANLKAGQLIVFQSTSYPGTTSEVIGSRITKAGFVLGKDVFLAFSPEREDPGNASHHLRNTPKLVGADDLISRNLATQLFETVIEKVVPLSSARAAEAAKLTENIFRSVNIALVNELKMIFDGMDIDIWEVIDAAKTKPFGFMPFYPGPGLGGHCIPIDPFYLTWKARAFAMPTRFIELAGEVNTDMPFWVVERVAKAIDHRVGKGLTVSKILIVGVAYKKNVADMRESPSLRLIELFLNRGAQVDYYDPHVKSLPYSSHHPELAGMSSVEMTPAAIANYDALVICTDHDDVDYQAMVDSAKVLVDTRNVVRRKGIKAEHLILA